MHIPILDLKPQYNSLKAEIQIAIDRVLTSCEFILGQDVRLFEQEVATYLEVPHAIAVNSGTDALMIGLRAMGVGPGDEVITTPFSFFATAESISNVGATPVFVDVELESYNLDVGLIESRISPRTRAIMPVHLFGRPANMGQIMELATTHGLGVLEDCAQSFGARYMAMCPSCHGQCSGDTRDRLAGTFTGTLGTVGAFSFFPTKNLGAYGDGGLVVTHDGAIAEVAQKLRVHGSKERYRNEVFGYNSRLDSLQAAILRVKLPHLEAWNQARRRIAVTYGQLLADVPGVVTPAVVSGHVFHQYTIRVLHGRRDELREFLAQRSIGSMVYYPVPQDRLPVYDGKFPPNLNSEQLAAEVLSLPLWPELTDDKLGLIAMAIAEGLGA
ncbi:MAG: DegT/DnrJ/EryC1/StrS family aminotransferase [Oscillatoriales cyanobacterium SM2_2_1]|nr:DegT/DnrJ/EryC1/StrS family aminotransferase [Oscillatoriales cyanobacterium SM2_2_1]